MSIKDVRFSRETRTLRGLLQNTSKLPVVVKTKGQDGFRSVFPDTTDRLPVDVMLFVERRSVVDYASVRILNFHDDDKMMSEKGCDFVLEHNNYVDCEFLMPLNYGGEAKLVDRPGKRRRYASVTQVIEDLPMYVTVNEDTETVSPNSYDDVIEVKAGIKLRVVEVRTSDVDNMKYLICKDAQKKAYAFKETARVNFTAANDKKRYTLQKLSKLPMPKVFEFLNVSPNGVILKDDEMASTLHIMTSGPLEILNVERHDVIVSWIRDEENKTFDCVLIPTGLWDKENVATIEFDSKGDLDNFIVEYFWPCRDSTFIENKLYVTQQSKVYLTYLRAPHFAGMKSAIMDCFKDKDAALPDYEIPDQPPLVPPPRAPDPDLLDYEVPIPENFPPPPQPGRRKLSSDQSEDEAADARAELTYRCDVLLPTARPKDKDILQKLAEKTKLGFDNVHSDIRSFFARKKTPKLFPKPPQVYSRENSRERPIAKPRRSSESQYLGQSQGPLPVSVKRSISLSSADETLPKDRYLHRELPPIPSVQSNVPGELPDDQVNSNYDYPDVTEFRAVRGNKPPYVIVDGIDLERIARENQTDEDFYRYSVQEVTECFRMCAMTKLAELCAKEKIDGEFLRQVDFSMFSKAPFNLPDFDVMKVKKIITKGWRPKL